MVSYAPIKFLLPYTFIFKLTRFKARDVCIPLSRFPRYVSQTNTIIPLPLFSSVTLSSLSLSQENPRHHQLLHILPSKEILPGYQNHTMSFVPYRRIAKLTTY
ncbi:hypothetical protein L1887_15113 [Cichorium endivia]|nr:hypothetical protein L1887_15113 [Cichorium endivia]